MDRFVNRVIALIKSPRAPLVVAAICLLAWLTSATVYAAEPSSASPAAPTTETGFWSIFAKVFVIQKKPLLDYFGNWIKMCNISIKYFHIHHGFF